MEKEIVKGGEGRSAEELLVSAIIVLGCVVGGIFLLILIAIFGTI